MTHPLVKMTDCSVPGCSTQINFSRRIKLCPRHLHHRDLCTCKMCNKMRTKRQAEAAARKEPREPYRPPNPWSDV